MPEYGGKVQLVSGLLEPEGKILTHRGVTRVPWDADLRKAKNHRNYNKGCSY